MIETSSPAVLKIGTDICATSRIQDAYERFGDKFLQRILTEDEREYVQSAPRHLIHRLAGRFAAKEATVKALGTGWRGVGWRDVEVIRRPTGEPGLELHGRAAARAETLGLNRFEVSLSHEREYAVAFVIAWKDK